MERSAAKRQESARYRTIVADPPWDHSDGTGFNYGAKAFGGKHTPVEPHATRPPYEMMGVNEIASVMHAVTRPGLGLAERDCHLYMWTTSRYLRDSFDIIEEIGFSVSATLVWCKAPMGFMGGAFRSSVEFIQFARRGSLPHQTQADRRWFTWPRVGWTQADPASKHSRKPDAFLDLVEQVSPGPYLEMFSRRARLGWDTWGNEALHGTGLVA